MKLIYNKFVKVCWKWDIDKYMPGKYKQNAGVKIPISNLLKNTKQNWDII